MGACTSVTRDKDPITANQANNSSGTSKVIPFTALKESKTGNFGELNNSITLNRQQSVKKKSFKDDSQLNEENEEEDVGFFPTEINEFR